jgi:hypothetical protein
MLHYLLKAAPTEPLPAERELKFYEWLKHQKKVGRVVEYWAFKDKPGLAAVLKLNFASDLEELLSAWAERAPSEFSTEALLAKKAHEAELAKKMLG